MDKINTIHGVFEEQVNHFPNQLAVLNDVQSLTYIELNRKANQLAHYLRELGLTPDMPVALCFERSVEFLIAILAILKAGGAYLPLDPLQPEDRLSFLLNDSQAPILITKSQLKHKFSDHQNTLIFLDKDKNIDQQITDNPDPINTPEHLAYIIYTSGSTGTPKGVLIEHLSTSIVPLMLGLTVVICDEVIKKNIRNYLNHLVNSHINIIKLTPSYFKVLLQETKNNFVALTQLSSIILGGENLSASECKSWLSFYPEHILFNEYGPTEATVAVSSYTVNAQNIERLDASIPIGIAGTNMSCIVLGNNNLPSSDNEIGELFIGGVCLARGYLNQPELTQQQFIINNGTRLYKTGDLCKKHSNGIIEYLGRIDEQVKIRGFRIEPGEIEKQLLSHTAIKEAAVLAQKDSFSEQRLVVYYILKDKDTLLNINQLRQYLQKHLPDYMIPTVFVKIDSFPLTANGKLHKAALPIPLLTTSHNYLEPKTALEKKLAEIWSEELGVQLIGIHDDFFDLGGHSLSAARIVSKINHELERTISLNDFYKATNIAQLVPIIKQTKKSKRRRAFRKFIHHKITKIPLSDFQFLLWMSNIFEPKAQKLNIVARKRFQGRLNKAALEFAFQAILKKHEALTYQILKFQPAQKVQKKSPAKLIIHDLQTSSIQQREKTLQKSLAQLFSYYPWPKNAPLLIIKLFYLQEDESELQICIPHLISDEYCMDIIFSELS
ncbi:MAG: AMP-binding protein, partial [Legionella longbeachae]|nr:AMP-binding protein [Legionella longbeachae]